MIKPKFPCVTNKIFSCTLLSILISWTGTIVFVYQIIDKEIFWFLIVSGILLLIPQTTVYFMWLIQRIKWSLT